MVATGLSERTVNRRLKELEKTGVLSATQTKTFPSMRRYAIRESSKETAHAALTILRELPE